MNSNAGKRALVWGGLMIVLGGLLLVEVYAGLNAWVWVAILFFAGLIAFGVYLTERSDWGMLLTAYILWTITGLIALVTLDVLWDDIIAFYVLFAIAIPFLVVYLRDRKQWWALIPAYVLAAVGLMVGLIGLGILSDILIPTYILSVIAIPFLVVYLRDHKQWWALIPVYVLVTIALMILLIEAEILAELLIPAYIMFAIALPFYFVFALNRSQWWALIPAGIMTVIGFSFFAAEGFFIYGAAAVLIVVGLWILVRGFTRKEAAKPDASTIDQESEESEIE